MTFSPALLTYLAAFFIVALASRQIGKWFAAFKMPLITGFLFVGIVTGPYVLKIINSDIVSHLRFIDDLALAYIAFSAGSELVLRQIRSRLRAIRFITIGLIASTLVITSFGFYFLSGFIPLIKEMPDLYRMAGSLMVAAIMVSRAPSSAIAIVNELKARGPFTKTVLGITVIKEGIVIVLFSFSASIAEIIYSGKSFDPGFMLILLIELILTVASGFLISFLIRFILSRHYSRFLKTLLIMGTGFGVFVFSRTLAQFSQEYFSCCILLEPLLICMLASFLTANYSAYRTELVKVLHDIGPIVYTAFFTLTGASLQLDVLAGCWAIAVLLFGIRLAAIFIGSFSGSYFAGESMRNSKIGWMCHITQAGVALGLAKQMSNQFPEWGGTVSTIVIAVIVLTQIVGPPFFKWALYLVGEAKSKTETHDKDDIRDAIIFGLEGESISLARLLQSNDWEVKIATNQEQYAKEGVPTCEIEIHTIKDLDLTTFKKLGVGQADAIVAMLSDEENYRICELVHENFGISNFIVRLNQHAYYKRFHELGAVIVEPRTAIVNLLDQFVRSPSAARLLMGLEQGRKIFEFELRNPDLKGVAIRDLHLSLDLHILSIRRNGELIISVGFTRLELGDWLTVVGSRASLEQMMRQFGESRDEEVLSMINVTTSKSLYSSGMVNEAKKIIHDRDSINRSRFADLVDNCTLLDPEGFMTCEQFFEMASESLSARMQIEKECILNLLMEREREGCTAFRPDLAIPHIIIEGENRFHLLVARCRKGIYYSELAPKVQAVFLLAGTGDQREFHLYALASIATAVQQPYFHEKWMKSHNEEALKNILRTGNTE